MQTKSGLQHHMTASHDSYRKPYICNLRHYSGSEYLHLFKHRGLLVYSYVYIDSYPDCLCIPCALSSLGMLHIPFGIESWLRFLALSASLSRLLGEISCGYSIPLRRSIPLRCSIPSCDGSTLAQDRNS
jgi:hypothetical protein